MATEQKKLENQTRIGQMILIALAAAIWDFVGESAAALGNQIGEEILNLLEKEMGVEIAGEKPEDVLTELGRVVVDELGFAKVVEVKREGSCLILGASGTITGGAVRKLQELGVTKDFVSPGLNTGLAALKRIGIKARGDASMTATPGEMILKFDLL